MARKRKYTRKELEKKIEEYFKNTKTPGVIGLAVYLDVCRDTIHQWRTEKGPFSDLLKRALDRIAAAHESKLYEGKPTGSIFWLKCQDKWKESQDLNIKHQGDVSLSINIQDLQGL